jgi:MscS family membrane protein
MIQIWVWEILLPPALTPLAGPWGSALGTLLFWLAAALVVQFIVFGILRVVAQRTETEWEDVVIDVSRRPLILVLVLLGMVNSLDHLGLHDALTETVRRWMIAAVIAIVTYWAWRVVKEIVIHYGQEYARRSETRVDDVLLPIVDQFAPLVFSLLGGTIILQYLGVRLDALLVAIGGAAFILAFALQDILSNVFGGLSLLVDTPFKYGDLVMLEDGKICQVVRIGVRVTQLYDIYAHALIYMPNSKLANERLINLMQPTPELVSTVTVELQGDADVERARQLLMDVLDGHPDLVGDIERKMQVAGQFEILPAEKRAHGLARLRAEQEVNRTVLAGSQSLRALARQVSQMERGGLTRAERAELLAEFEKLAASLGWIDRVDKRLDAHRGGLEEFIDSCVRDLAGDSLATRSWTWVDAWTLDPDLSGSDDADRLRARWAGRVLALLRRVDGMHRRLARADSLEQRLDDALNDLAAWIPGEFKQPAPGWKHSSVAFRGVANGVQQYALFFYVDDIELEHFFRQSRVEGQVRREIMRRLPEAGLRAGTPRREVRLVDGPGAGTRSEPGAEPGG